ncbi:MAG: hypothetical protein ACREVQ_08830 [Burkholderiales bacterium]
MRKRNMVNPATSFARAGRALLAGLAAVAVAYPAHADDRHDRGGRDEHAGHAEHAEPARANHFDDHHRQVVNDYYVKEYHGRRCPPGFVHAGKECSPPHHARQWERGKPLPRNVVYHTVPKELVVQLGAPPPGHKYVRVASDILLIAVGTGLVVDSINDLGR